MDGHPGDGAPFHLFLLLGDKMTHVLECPECGQKVEGENDYGVLNYYCCGKVFEVQDRSDHPEDGDLVYPEQPNLKVWAADE